MFGRRLPLGRVLGIPLSLDLSFLLVLPLLALLISAQFPLYLELFGIEAREDLLRLRFLLGLLAALGLFGSVLLHELGHALMARAFGVRTREITLWLLGGVAQLERIPREPAKEAAIAIAGPLVSFALSGVFTLLKTGEGALGFLLTYLALVNLFLGLFNLLPALPLDGGRILRAFLATRLPYLEATRRAVGVSRGLALALGLFGLLAFNPFLVLIAFFVYMASGAEAEAILWQEALKGLKVQDLMTPEVQTVPPDLKVGELLARMLQEKHVAYPVVEGGRVLGLVHLDHLGPASLEDPVALWMQPPAVLPPEASALEALERMGGYGYTHLLVIEGGELKGILSKTDLLRALEVLSRIRPPTPGEGPP